MGKIQHTFVQRTLDSAIPLWPVPCMEGREEEDPWDLLRSHGNWGESWTNLHIQNGGQVTVLIHCINFFYPVYSNYGKVV